MNCEEIKNNIEKMGYKILCFGIIYMVVKEDTQKLAVKIYNYNGWNRAKVYLSLFKGIKEFEGVNKR